VPNATVMLVESADRFGLSQLHQFRPGGRGTEQSYCILLAEEPTEIGRRRLDIIQDVQSGFVLAEEDLKLRGPGSSSVRGRAACRLAYGAVVRCFHTGGGARRGEQALRSRPKLKKPEHRLLAKELARVWQTEGEWS